MGNQVGVQGGGRLDEQIKVVNAITTQVAAAAVDGDIIDRQGFNAAVVNYKTGVATNGAVAAFKVVHGDDAALADVADAVAGDFGAVSASGVAASSNGSFAVDLRGLKRYVRIVGTPDKSGITLGASLVLGAAERLPVA